MRVSFIENDQSCHLAFSGHMTSRYRRELGKALASVLKRHGQVQLDLSQVQEIDDVGIGFLCVLDVLGGGKTTVVHSSSAVQDAYARLAPDLLPAGRSR